MLAGIKRALGKEEGRPTLHFEDNAPSWEELQQLVAEKQSALGLQTPDLETGPTNPLALRRTFGKSEEPRVKLYRDHAAWCPYCQKIWLQLEEKRIPYVMEKVNMRCYGEKPPSYTAKVPSGLLPAMELDGKLYTESALIARLLEEAFPERPLLPALGAPGARRVDGLMRLERRLFGDWLQWLCRSWNHESAKSQFIFTMDEVEAELGKDGGPFFLGKELSLVDVTFAPFLERIVASIPYYKGFIVRGQGRWKNLEAWFGAMEARPEYLGTKSDFYTHCHDLPPQLGGCVSVPEAAATAAAIDGTDAGSWRLPLEPLSASSLEPYSPGSNEAVDTWEAAAALVKNHGPVVRFAARGVGQPGSRPVTAPLADPSATAGEQHLPVVDAALRHVAHALLVGVDAKQASGHALKTSGAASGALDGAPAVPSAEYLRDRIGVPRDMKFPAARQFRAHLNWLIDSLQGQ